MSIDVAIEIRNDLTAAFARAVEAAVDLTPVMRQIAGRLADETRKRFETSRAPDGAPWKPSERVIEKGGKTLVDRGDLLSSIREDYGPDYAAAGPEASAGAAVYAAIHQFGGKIVPKAGREGKGGARPALHFGGRHLASVTIPARPYLGFTDADADYAITAIGDHLARAFEAGA